MKNLELSDYARNMIYKTNRGIGEAVVCGNYTEDSFIKRIKTIIKKGELSKEDVKNMLNEIYQRVVLHSNGRVRNDAFESLKNKIEREG